MKTPSRIRQNQLKIRKLSLSAILCALGVMLLYIGSVLDVLDLSMAAIASMLEIFAVIEMHGAYPWLIYGVTSLLSLLLLPNKLPALLYLFFAGIYPILKAKLEHLPRTFEWICKLLFFNLMLLAIVAVSEYLFHLPDTGLSLNWIVFAVANPVFILYDTALTVMITFYTDRLRSRLHIGKYFDV